MSERDPDFSTLTLPVVIFALLAVSVVWRCFVASWLWLWFAVPLGAPELSAAHLIGLVLLIGTLRGSRKNPLDKRPPKEVAEDMGADCVQDLPLFALLWGAGWVAHTLL